LKAFEILVEDKRVREKRDEYGWLHGFAHMHRPPQAICEKKSSKKVQMSNFATKVLGASGLREHRRVERKVGKY
jgi:hypothetical protein